jgi:hypothetical protein
LCEQGARESVCEQDKTVNVLKLVAQENENRTEKYIVFWSSMLRRLFEKRVQ